MKNKKAQVSLYISLSFIVLIIILLASLIAPMGARFSTILFNEGLGILADTNSTIQNITDPNVKASLEGVFDSAINSGVTNISVATNLYQYAWVFIIGISCLITFLVARRLVEYGGNTGFI